MTGHQFLEVDNVAGDAAVITAWLARPPVNAVNQQMYREIRAFFRDVGTAFPRAKAVILAGRGAHFCAGNDLPEFETLDGGNGDARMTEVREAFEAVRHCAVPVVAAVTGAALGTGLALAASADLIVAGRSGRFGVPEIGVGVMGGARHLGRLVPPGEARRMFLTGDPVSAEDLSRHGGIAAVVDDDQVHAAAVELARRITRHSRLAIEVAKISLNRVERMPLEEGYRFEQGLTVWLSRFADSKEALAAVRDGRPPVFADEVPAEGVLDLLTSHGRIADGW